MKLFILLVGLIVMFVLAPLFSLAFTIAALAYLFVLESLLGRWLSPASLAFFLIITVIIFVVKEINTPDKTEPNWIMVIPYSILALIITFVLQSVFSRSNQTDKYVGEDDYIPPVRYDRRKDPHRGYRR